MRQDQEPVFKALIGDLFASKAGALMNPVNCVGIMGKGLALEFKRRYPEMIVDYAARCARKELLLGEPYLYREQSGILIMNFPTKDHWRSPSRLADIESGLDYFAQHFDDWGHQEFGFPGSGLRKRGAWMARGRTIDVQKVEWSEN